MNVRDPLVAQQVWTDITGPAGQFYYKCAHAYSLSIAPSLTVNREINGTIFTYRNIYGVEVIDIVVPEVLVRRYEPKPEIPPEWAVISIEWNSPGYSLDTYTSQPYLPQFVPDMFTMNHVLREEGETGFIPPRGLDFYRPETEATGLFHWSMLLNLRLLRDEFGLIPITIDLNQISWGGFPSDPDADIQCVFVANTPPGIYPSGRACYPTAGYGEGYPTFSEWMQNIIDAGWFVSGPFPGGASEFGAGDFINIRTATFLPPLTNTVLASMDYKSHPDPESGGFAATLANKAAAQTEVLAHFDDVMNYEEGVGYTGSPYAQATLSQFLGVGATPGFPTRTLIIQGSTTINLKNGQTSITTEDAEYVELFDF